MDVREGWSAPVREVSLVIDQAKLSTVEDLSASLLAAEEDARMSNDAGVHARVRELTASVKQAKEAAEATRLTFRFQGIGRRRFNVLLEDAPPVDPEMEFDPDKFVGPLLVECSLDGLTVEDVGWMMDHYTDAQVTKLFMAAWSANRAVKDIPFTSPGIEPVSDSGPNLTTALPEGSPTPTS